MWHFLCYNRETHVALLFVTKRRSSWASISNPNPEQETIKGTHAQETPAYQRRPTTQYAAQGSNPPIVTLLSCCATGSEACLGGDVRVYVLVFDHLRLCSVFCLLRPSAPALRCLGVISGAGGLPRRLNLSCVLSRFLCARGGQRMRCRG